MKLQLKSIKHFEAGSQETECFTADLWVNNKKVATVENDGHGGCHRIMPYPNQREVLRQAEAYAKSLPEVDGGHFKFDNDLEWQVSEMLTAFLTKKEISKHSRKGLYYETAEGNQRLVKWTEPIKKMLMFPNGVKTILKKVEVLKAEGCTILNNNLDSILT